MKIVTIIARVLLGLVFLVFGLNSILHFIPVPPMPPSDSTTFSTLLLGHGYFSFIGVLEVLAGVLLLIGRYVPVGLTLLGPILINILLYHTLFHAPGIGAGLVCTLLEVFLIYAYWPAFRSIFSAKLEPGARL